MDDGTFTSALFLLHKAEGQSVLCYTWYLKDKLEHQFHLSVYVYSSLTAYLFPNIYMMMTF